MLGGAGMMPTPKHSEAKMRSCEKLLRMVARRCMQHQKCKRHYYAVKFAALKHIALLRMRPQNLPYFEKRAEILNEMFERHAMQKSEQMDGR
jgi:hypothetical protein